NLPLERPKTLFRRGPELASRPYHDRIKKFDADELSNLPEALKNDLIFPRRRHITRRVVVPDDECLCIRQNGRLEHLPRMHRRGVQVTDGHRVDMSHAVSRIEVGRDKMLAVGRTN